MLGICFEIQARDEPELRSLPPPTSTQRMNAIDGKSKMTTVFYHFSYMPQSWKEWQHVASIKVQIAARFEGVKFLECGGVDEVNGSAWTIRELGGYFPAFVRWPKPLFPPTKKELYRMLCIHAKELYRRQTLHQEQLTATAQRFNSALGHPYSYRDTLRKAAAAYRFALDHCATWPQKLDEKSLKKVRQGAAAATNEKKKQAAEEKRRQILELLPEHTRPNGRPNIKALAGAAGVSRRTVERALQS